MPVNEIKPFGAAGTVANGDVMDLTAYDAEPQRLTGNQAGIARRELVNTVLRQVSHMAAGLAQFVDHRSMAGVYDDGDLDALEAAIDEAITAMIAEAMLDPLDGLRDLTAGAIRLWPSEAIPVLSDGLPMGLPLDGAVVDLTTYSRLDRVLCPSADNGWAPAWYRCDAGGGRDLAGGYIRLDDWRGGYPQMIDAGAGRNQISVLMDTTTGNAVVTIVNNLSGGGTLITPYAGSDGIYPGMPISGPGIPAGATVLSVAGSSVTLSAACTATGAGVQATVTGRMLGSWQGDAARIITGGVGYTTSSSWSYKEFRGCLTYIHDALGRIVPGDAGGTGDTSLIVDTSRVGPTAPTTRPAGPASNYIILI